MFSCAATVSTRRISFCAAFNHARRSRHSVVCCRRPEVAHGRRYHRVRRADHSWWLWRDRLWCSPFASETTQPAAAFSVERRAARFGCYCRWYCVCLCFCSWIFLLACLPFPVLLSWLSWLHSAILWFPAPLLRDIIWISMGPDVSFSAISIVCSAHSLTL